MIDINITGVEVCGDGTMQIRTVTVIKRFWHRQPRYRLAIHKGYVGFWRGVPGGKKPGSYMQAHLDAAYTAAHDAVYGVEPTKFEISEVRAVTEPTLPSGDEQEGN